MSLSLPSRAARMLASMLLACGLVACSGSGPGPSLASAPVGSVANLSAAAKPLLDIARSTPHRPSVIPVRGPSAGAAQDDPGQRLVEDVSLNRVFNWAERTFPDLFPNIPATLREGPFTYRYHPGTGNYVAVDDNNIVWILGPALTGGQAVALGAVTPFLGLVRDDALVIYRLAGSVFLDAREFLAPTGQPGEFNWNVVSGPAGWPGIFYGDANGVIGFNPGNASGELNGVYQFELQQQNPGGGSTVRAVQVHICCDARTPLAEISAFATRLQRWSLPDIAARFAAADKSSLNAMFRFANTFGLGAVDLDLLRGVALGTTYDEALIASIGPPSGGSRLQGASYPMQGVARVSKDLASVAYPGDYTASATVALPENPYCTYESETTLLRVSDIGSYALPQIQARKWTQPSVGLVADMKDVWGRLGPQYQIGCAGDFRKVYLQALTELARNGVSQITLRPWTVFDGTGATWKVLQPNDGGAISDADFEWMVQAAHARGMKVAWANQIQMALKDANGQIFSTAEATPERVARSMEALDTFLLERGEFMQRIGVDAVWMPGAWYWADFKSALGTAEYVTRTRGNLAALRTHYKGQVVSEPDTDVLQDAPSAAAINAYFYSPQAYFPESDLNLLSVDFLLQRFNESYQGTKAVLGGRTIVYYMNAASYRKFFHSGYLEETFCTNGYGLDSGPFSSLCVQKTHQPDMALQAIYHEAALRFLADHPELDVSQAAMQYWWMAENPIAGTSFPNLATSVRGKPAETIVHRWFAAQK